MKNQPTRSERDLVDAPDDAVDAGEMRLAAAPSLLATTGLGSGLGIAVQDRRRRLAGVLHAVLPDHSLDPARARELPALFVDAGLELLVGELQRLGADREELRAVVAGAADARGCDAGAASLGCRNLVRAREVLAGLGVPIEEEYTGGYRMLSLSIHVGDGTVAVCDATGREVGR